MSQRARPKTRRAPTLRSFRAIALLLPLSAIVSDPAFGNSITLTPSADTGLFAAFPDNSLGANANFVVGVADVQLWLLNPAANVGWLLISEPESTPFSARRIGSREHTNNTPVLNIEYTVPFAADDLRCGSHWEPNPLLIQCRVESHLQRGIL